MILLNDDVIKHIYTFNYTIQPVNKMLKDFVNEKKNRSALKIQKMFKNNKIEKEMPILFMDELYSGIIPKWLLIRMYMKFYPMDDIVSLPIHLLKNNFTKDEIKNNKEYSEIWEKFNYEYPEILWQVTAYEVFCVLHKFSLQQLIKMGI